MATREANTKKDKNVKEFLVNNSDYFKKMLGQPVWNGNYLAFPSAGLPFIDLKMRCYIDVKFLAKIYASVFEAKFTAKMPGTEWIRTEMVYSGLVRKGKPHFRISSEAQDMQHDKGRLLCDLLNSQQCILDTCRLLDMEFLKVFFDPQEQVWKILLRPYGGSLVWVMIPPMKYNVVLPGDHAKAILSVTKMIAQLIQGKYLI